MLSKRPGRILLLVITTVFSLSVLFAVKPVSADIIQNRSITLSTAVPSAVASHDFKFTIPSASNLGSIVFEYCSNSPLSVYPCAAPAGLDVSSTVLATQTGNTGFSIDSVNTTPNKIVLTRPAAPGLITAGNYIFDNITNPSTPGQTVYVRLSTHASTDGSGPSSDSSAVAFSVASAFNIGAYVPPFLKLCVGITVAPDCSSQSGDSLDLGNLTINAVRAGQSQFSTATNDPSGYVIFALGTTMTSGNNIIPSLASPVASFPGTGQFGMNLRANTIPGIGQDPVGVGTGAPTSNYNTPNHYMFSSGDSITTANLPSNYNRMTVTYIANIPSKQPAGVYTTTITYVATVQF